jgi:hypothetical protein
MLFLPVAFGFFTPMSTLGGGFATNDSEEGGAL